MGALLFAVASVASPAVTLNLPATRLEDVLAAVSSQVGIELKCDKELANEPVMLFVKHVPLGDLKENLAKALAGKWETENSVLTLKVDTRLSAAYSKAAKAEWHRRVADEIEWLKNELTQPYDGSASYSIGASREHLFGVPGSPSRRMAVRLFTSLSPDKLADLEDEDWLTVSLGSNDPFLHKLLQNLTAELDVAAAKGDGQVSQWDMTDMGVRRSALGPGSLESCHLLVRRFGEDFSILMAFDLKNSLMQPTTSYQVRAARRPATNLDVPESKAELSAESKWLRDILSWNPTIGNTGGAGTFTQEVPEIGTVNVDFTSGQTVAPPEVPESVRTLFVRGEKDPLAFFPSDVVRSISGQTGDNTLAYVSDHAFSVLGRYQSRSNTAEATNNVKALVRDYGHILERHDGWTILRTANPAASRADRMDRKLLSETMRSADAKGFASIADLVKLRRAARGHRPQLLEMLKCVSAETYEQANSAPWEVIDLWDQLRPDKAAGLGRDFRAFPLTTDKARRSALKWAVKRGATFLKDIKSPGIGAEHGFSVIFSEGERPATSIDCAIHGLPQVANMRIRLIEDQGFLCRRESPLTRSFTGLGEISLGLASSELASYGVSAPRYGGMTQFTPLPRRTYQLVIDTGSDQGSPAALTEVELDPKAKATSFDSLPDGLRKSIYEIKDKLKPFLESEFRALGSAFTQRGNTQRIKP
ncbi:MAG: hypothetical protein JSS66_01575 [Armatimonadetes bacterium]|nr:hypothetical protein [Armatimonadota bacterium]